MSDDTFVRSDVFAETMKRFEAMMASSEARTASLIADSNARLEVYRAGSRREAESLAAGIKSIKDKFDSMEAASSRRWAIAGFDMKDSPLRDYLIGALMLICGLLAVFSWANFLFDL